LDGTTATAIVKHNARQFYEDEKEWDQKLREEKMAGSAAVKYGEKQVKDFTKGLQNSELQEMTKFKLKSGAQTSKYGRHEVEEVQAKLEDETNPINKLQGNGDAESIAEGQAVLVPTDTKDEVKDLAASLPATGAPRRCSSRPSRPRWRCRPRLRRRATPSWGLSMRMPRLIRRR